MKRSARSPTGIDSVLFRHQNKKTDLRNLSEEKSVVGGRGTVSIIKSVGGTLNLGKRNLLHPRNWGLGKTYYQLCPRYWGLLLQGGTPT